MKKYFVTSDIHSFMDPFFTALINSGFSWYNEDHILIICGDIFDRGPDSKRLLDFLSSLNDLNRLILIKGNHEDLMEQLLDQLKNHYSFGYHHIMNGTVDTLEQLTNVSKYDMISGLYDYEKDIESKLDKYFKLIKQAKDYYEINDYIFVHGWIPHVRDYTKLIKCIDEDWKKARWMNGMEDWYFGWKFEGKTIICGHWHTSFGNYKYHSKGSGQFEEDSDFGIFEDEGIIALDACTAYTNKVNIKVLEI